MVSKQFSLRSEDWKKWAKNALIFAGPAILVLISSFIEIIPKDAQWGVVALYLINVILDLSRKWLNENKY